MVIASRDGVAVIHLKDQETDRPEIDRGDLRRILLESLPEGTIKWNHHLRKVEAGTLHFADGTTESGFDLIVGADGAWSKVRPLLTTVNPFYSGITMVEIKLRDMDTKHPELSAFLGDGSYFALGEEEERALLCQRQSDRSVRVYCTDWRPEHWLRDNGIDFKNPEDVRTRLLDEYKSWDSRLQDLIRYCDDDMAGRPLYMLPPGLRWSSKRGVTVLGDAAHLATPFAGMGVNAALTDAMILAESIIAEYNSSGDMDKAIKEYEKKMHPLANKVTTETWTNLLMRFQEGGIAHMQERVNRGLEELEKEKRRKGEGSEEVEQKKKEVVMRVAETAKVDGN